MFGCGNSYSSMLFLNIISQLAWSAEDDDNVQPSVIE